MVLRSTAVTLALCAATLGCGARGRDNASASHVADRLEPLRAFEASSRKAADFAKLPTADAVLGPDPYRIVALPGAGPARFIGVLRNRNAVVLLDAHLHEIARAETPPSPSGAALLPNGDVVVVGEQSSRVARYAVGPAALTRVSELDVDHVRAMRDVAAGPDGTLYAVEEHDDQLITFEWPHTRPGETAKAARRRHIVRASERICAGPFRVARLRTHLVVDCLIDHALVVRRVAEDGTVQPSGPIVRHDGPIWGFDAIEDRDGVLVAAGGVENRPLDRSGGSFGYIDSFVYLYRFDDSGAQQLAAINVSEQGVITPKAVALRLEQGNTLRVDATGYGSDKRVTIVWPSTASDVRPTSAPTFQTTTVVPGIASIARASGGFVGADPLLDAWVAFDAGPASVIAALEPGPPPAPRSVDSRLGEALFFTSLMAPWNKSDGPLSRFTCETCHFEGYIDGRTHHTGRGDVHATTKPLVGLFNNGPHFSRALDPDLTTVANNEFTVAGAKSEHDPWFSLVPANAPWLAHIGVGPGVRPPEDLRRALMQFLMDFTHRPNPAVAGRTSFSAEERAGAELFRDRCESCHEARLASDDPKSRVPFDAWEKLVFSHEGPIVWGSSEYKKTGVEPYVHEKGARVPSLRRLYKKRPYFTNGSAEDLASVIGRARFRGAELVHDERAAAGDGWQVFTGREERALLTFLDLL